MGIIPTVTVSTDYVGKNATTKKNNPYVKTNVCQKSCETGGTLVASGIILGSAGAILAEKDLSPENAPLFKKTADFVNNVAQHMPFKSKKANLASAMFLGLAGIYVLQKLFSKAFGLIGVPTDIKINKKLANEADRLNTGRNNIK